VQIACLLCKTELRTYFIAEMTFLPYKVRHSHAMLERPECGHVEFLAKNSRLEGTGSDPNLRRGRRLVESDLGAGAYLYVRSI
jgi:hypothetical protein